jgi:hypothetical protein
MEKTQLIALFKKLAEKKNLESRERDEESRSLDGDGGDIHRMEMVLLRMEMVPVLEPPTRSQDLKRMKHLQMMTKKTHPLLLLLHN